MAKLKKIVSDFMPYLTKDDVIYAVQEKGECSVKIVSEPVEKPNEKFGGTQMVVNGVISHHKETRKDKDGNEHPDDGKRQWSMNATTFNFLVDKFGEDSTNWLGQVVELETVEQSVKGKITNVVYAVGSAKEATSE